MTQFQQLVRELAKQNMSDKDFAMLADTCELEPLCDKDTFAVRVLRIHNMIDSLHMNGCLAFSSYLPIHLEVA
jgi:hypothetical protein